MRLLRYWASRSGRQGLTSFLILHMKQIYRLLMFGLAICCLLGFSFDSYAGIGIDPIQVEIIVEKGGEAKRVFRVFNTGEKSCNVEIRLEDWLLLGVRPHTWFKIEPQKFPVMPGQYVDVEYLISVPKDSIGEIMTMVFFDSLDEGSTVGVGFGIPVYVAVKGTEVVDAEVTELKAEYNPDTGISGFVKIKNKGNVHIRPYTTIQVLNSEGKASAYFSVQFGIPVQINKERKYEFEKKDIKLKKGRYRVIVECDYGTLYKLEKRARKKSRLVVE